MPGVELEEEPRSRLQRVNTICESVRVGQTGFITGTSVTWLCLKDNDDDNDDDDDDDDDKEDFKSAPSPLGCNRFTIELRQQRRRQQNTRRYPLTTSSK